MTSPFFAMVLGQASLATWSAALEQLGSREAVRSHLALGCLGLTLYKGASRLARSPLTEGWKVPPIMA